MATQVIDEIRFWFHPWWQYLAEHTFRWCPDTARDLRLFRICLHPIILIIVPPSNCLIFPCFRLLNALSNSLYQPFVLASALHSMSSPALGVQHARPHAESVHKIKQELILSCPQRLEFWVVFIPDFTLFTLSNLEQTYWLIEFFILLHIDAIKMFSVYTLLNFTRAKILSEERKMKRVVISPVQIQPSSYICYRPLVSWIICPMGYFNKKCLILGQGKACMMGRNNMEVNGQQSVDTGPRLWAWLICEHNLYAKIYGGCIAGCGVPRWQQITGVWLYANQVWRSLRGVHSSNM